VHFLILLLNRFAILKNRSSYIGFLFFVMFHLTLISFYTCHKEQLVIMEDCLLDTDNCQQNNDEIPICHEDEYETETYDIFLVMGQSNVHSGLEIDTLLDRCYPNIKQLGRHGNMNLKIIDAKEPLDNHPEIKNRIGFATTLSKLYACEFLEVNRKILIIPCGLGSSGFINNRWNKGNDLYEDAVSRANFILNKYPGSLIISILWHQGEVDIGNNSYQSNLDSMITNIRCDIMQTENTNIPFILGGMVPYWVNEQKERILLECIIKDTPNRIHRTAFADPRFPCTISKYDNSIDKIHFNSYGQREMGKRYFTELKKLVND